MIQKKSLFVILVVFLLIVSSEVSAGNIFSDAWNGIKDTANAAWDKTSCLGFCQSATAVSYEVRDPQISVTPPTGFQEFKGSIHRGANLVISIDLGSVREVSRIIGYHCGVQNYKFKYSFLRDGVEIYSSESTEYPGIPHKGKCVSSDLDFQSTNLVKNILTANGYPVADKVVVNFTTNKEYAYSADFTVYASTTPADTTKLISNQEQPYTFTGPILIYSTKQGAEKDFKNLESVLQVDIAGATRENVDIDRKSVCDTSSSASSSKDSCAFLTEQTLEDYTQLWIMDTDAQVSLLKAEKAIKDFNDRGGGVLIAGNNYFSFKIPGQNKGNAVTDSLDKFNDSNFPRYTKDPLTGVWVKPPGTANIYARNIAQFLEPDQYTSKIACELQKTSVPEKNAVWTGSNCCGLVKDDDKNRYYNDNIGFIPKGETEKKYGGCWNNQFVTSGDFPKDDKEDNIKNIINVNGQFYACKETPQKLFPNTPQGPDLVPTGLASESQTSPGGSFNADLIIKNQGDERIQNFKVRYFLVGNGLDFLVAATIFPSTDAKQSAMLTKSISVPRNMPVGTYQFKVVVNPDKDVKETDYSNNEIIGNQVGIGTAATPSSTPQFIPVQNPTPPVSVFNPDFVKQIKTISACSNIKNLDGTDFKTADTKQYINCKSNGEFHKSSSLLETKQTGWTVDADLLKVAGHDKDVPSSCCSKNECFNGTDCVGENKLFSNPAIKKLFLCEKQQTGNAVWTEPILRSTPEDYSKPGDPKFYCKQSSQCLLEPREISETPEKLHDGDLSDVYSSTKRPHCINNGQFFEDKYCNNGEWTSRTKFLIEQLMTYGKDKDFELSCGDPGEALNDASTEYFRKYNRYYSNTNNACVLRAGGKVLFGTTFNNPLKDKYFLARVIDTNNDCKDVTGSLFEECANKDGKKVFYNPSINATIITPSTETLTPADVSAFSKVKEGFDAIKNVVASFNTGGDEAKYKKYELVNNVKYFDTIFYQKKASKTIFGFLEKKTEYDGNEIYSYFALGVKYTNTGEPFNGPACTSTVATSLKNRIHSITNTDAECEQIDSNSIVILSKVEADADGEGELSIKQVWNDLTQKLRIT